MLSHTQEATSLAFCTSLSFCSPAATIYATDVPEVHWVCAFERVLNQNAGGSALFLTASSEPRGRLPDGSRQSYGLPTVQTGSPFSPNTSQPTHAQGVAPLNVEQGHHRSRPVARPAQGLSIACSVFTFMCLNGWNLCSAETISHKVDVFAQDVQLIGKRWRGLGPVDWVLDDVKATQQLPPQIPCLGS
jgi:hypothetical protein